MSIILGENLRSIHDRLGDMRELFNLLQEQTKIVELYPWVRGWVGFRIGDLEAILEITQLDVPESLRLEKLSRFICKGFGINGLHYRDIFKQVDENRETLHFLICHAPLVLKKTPARQWIYDLNKVLGNFISFFRLGPPFPEQDGSYPTYGRYPRPWPEKNHPGSMMLVFE